MLIVNYRIIPSCIMYLVINITYTIRCSLTFYILIELALLLILFNACIHNTYHSIIINNGVNIDNQ